MILLSYFTSKNAGCLEIYCFITLKVKLKFLLRSLMSVSKMPHCFLWWGIQYRSGSRQKQLSLGPFHIIEHQLFKRCFCKINHVGNFRCLNSYIIIDKVKLPSYALGNIFLLRNILPYPWQRRLIWRGVECLSPCNISTWEPLHCFSSASKEKSQLFCWWARIKEWKQTSSLW